MLLKYTSRYMLEDHKASENPSSNVARTTCNACTLHSNTMIKLIYADDFYLAGERFSLVL